MSEKEEKKPEEKEESSNDDNASQEAVDTFDNAAPVQSIPQAAAAEPQPIPQSAASQNVPPAPNAPIQTAQPVNQTAPAPVAQPAQESAPAAIPLTPDEDAAQRTAGTVAFGNDLKFGKIQPKTYQDLYADKSTLGKIGTLFGLMVSGAGSGITGQPNAVLNMMDQQIQRDFEAQKQNQANQQSWYGLALQHEKNLPENQMLRAQASKAESEAQLARWNNVQAGIEDVSASTEGLNHQTMATVQSVQDFVNKMPDGPQKDAAQANINNVLIPGAMSQIQQRNQETAQKRAVLQAANPMPPAKSNPPPKGEAKSGAKYDAVNENKLNAMIQKGKFAPNARDAIPPNLLGEVNKEKTDLTVNRNNLADADDSFNNLAKLKNAGQVPGIGSASNLVAGVAGTIGTMFGGPLAGSMAAGVGKLATALPGETLQQYFERNRSIQVEALKSRLGGGMSEDDKNKLANSLLPSWADSPDSMSEAHRKMVQHFESNASEVAPTLTRLGLKYDMPKYNFHAPAQPKKSSGAEGGF